MESRKQNITLTVAESDSKTRIDKFLAKNFSDYSRTFLKKLIEEGNVLVDGKEITPHFKVSADQKLTVVFPPVKSKIPKPENVDLKVIFENEDFAIINKPAGMIVHPTDDGKHMKGTLINALLGLYGKDGLSDLGGELRPGIVHRLDSDTSGLMIIAKNNKAHEKLVNIFKKREILKKYIALVVGHIEPEEGRIESPLERSKKKPGKIHIANEGEGKGAITLYKVIDYLELDGQKLTLLEVNILTGRTHQIRVHLNAIGYPVIGDTVYGNKKFNALFEKYGLKRQFLHAAELKFKFKGELIHKKSPLPKDLEGFLSKLNFE